MRCRERRKKPGDVLPVRNSYHYRLPPGLEEGAVVRLVHHDAGYWIVEAMGEQFTVFNTLIVAGFEYELCGLWLPEFDPRVQAALGRKALVQGQAYSCGASGCVNPPVS